MKHLKLKNEHGLTLVELLAVLVIASMIGIIAYAILFNGFKTYDRVKVEAQLRDEADIIMAELISELFTLKESEIAHKYLPQQNSNNYFIELQTGEKIGFYEGKVVLRNSPSKSLQTGQIKLNKNSEISEAKVDGRVIDGMFEISLTLEWKNNDQTQTLTTESEIGIIKE